MCSYIVLAEDNLVPNTASLTLETFLETETICLKQTAVLVGESGRSAMKIFYTLQSSFLRRVWTEDVKVPINYKLSLLVMMVNLLVLYIGLNTGV